MYMRSIAPPHGCTFQQTKAIICCASTPGAAAVPPVSGLHAETQPPWTAVAASTKSPDAWLPLSSELQIAMRRWLKQQRWLEMTDWFFLRTYSNHKDLIRKPLDVEYWWISSVIWPRVVKGTTCGTTAMYPTRILASAAFPVIQAFSHFLKASQPMNKRTIEVFDTNYNDTTNNHHTFSETPPSNPQSNHFGALQNHSTLWQICCLISVLSHCNNDFSLVTAWNRSFGNEPTPFHLEYCRCNTRQFHCCCGCVQGWRDLGGDHGSKDQRRCEDVEYQTKRQWSDISST